jgi:hypothetical protein
MNSQRPRARPHLASSPFSAAPEVPAKEFAPGDRVTHDREGLGRVTEVEASSVLVDFGSRTVRVSAPYSKLHRL